MSIWLDQVLATPTLGVLLKPCILSQHEYISALRPLIEECLSKGGVYEPNTPTEPGGGTNIELSYPDGYTYRISAMEITVQFRYAQHLAEPESPGLLPKSVEYEHEFEPYGQLLQRTLEKTAALLERFPGEERRALGGIGIVGSCAIASGSPPPGIVAFVNHIGRPWQTDLISGRVTLAAELASTEHHMDACQHRLVWESEQTNIHTRLEWQRTFRPELEADGSRIHEQFVQCVPLALQYFERFGAGDLNYASLVDQR